MADSAIYLPLSCPSRFLHEDICVSKKDVDSLSSTIPPRTIDTNNDCYFLQREDSRESDDKREK